MFWFRAIEVLVGSVRFEKQHVAFYFSAFSAACLMAIANLSTTSWKEEVEKKRQETEELQNKLQEASAMQALTEASALLPQSLQIWLSNILQGISLCFLHWTGFLLTVLSMSCHTDSTCSCGSPVVVLKDRRWNSKCFQKNHE